MKYLTDYMKEKQSRLFEETGAFFAFSKEQFEEKRDKNVKKYVHIGHGLLVPKGNEDIFIERFEKIGEEGRLQDVKENGARGIIRREYFNFETQLTGDTSEMLKSLKPYQNDFPNLFSDEAIQTVIRESKREAIEKDLF